MKVTAIPAGKKRGWTVRVNGQESTSVDIFEIDSRFGTLTYGLRPEGYDGWTFREAGGGGDVTLPFSFTADGELIVGLLLESRPNMGDHSVWCAIGGFIEAGETHEESQARETAEEAGINARKAQMLPGLPTNANRAFFVADPLKDEGVHAFGLELPFSQFEPDGQCWKLKASAVLPGFKKASDARFFRWNEAITGTADSLARAAIAQLVAHLFAGVLRFSQKTSVGNVGK